MWELTCPSQSDLYFSTHKDSAILTRQQGASWKRYQGEKRMSTLSVSANMDSPSSACVTGSDSKMILVQRNNQEHKMALKDAEVADNRVISIAVVRL